MTIFEKRERAFENKFANEQEMNFIVTAKACSLLARWVAEEKIGMSKKAADRYCGKILALTIRDCNPQTLYSHIQQRLKKHKIDISNQELEAQYLKALNMARGLG